MQTSAMVGELDAQWTLASPLWQCRRLICTTGEARGGGPDRLLTPLHFQDAKMHQTAQAEHMEVQKRGNHGTLSAQLHNEKRNTLVVSILHVMFRGPVAQPPRLRSDQHSLPPHARLPGRDSFSPKKEPETKQLINIICELVQSIEKKQEHYVS